LGGVFGVIGVWLRRWLSETPVFMAMQARREENAELPLRAVLREHRLAMLPAMMLTCVLTSAVVTFVVITPTMMQKTFGMSRQPHLRLERVGIVFLNIGCVLAGLLVDRIGAWRGVILYSLLLPLGIGVLYASLVISGCQLGRSGLRGGRAGCGVVGAVPSVMVSLFPATDSSLGHFLYLQHCLRTLGEYHAAAVDRPDAVEPMDLRGFCAVMGAVGVGSAAYFGTRMPSAGLLGRWRSVSGDVLRVETIFVGQS
jgi:hypothetical protein